MRIRIGLEKYPTGRILAYALDFPGCFTYGMDDAEVLLQLPLALLNFEKWIRDHTDNSWVVLNSMDMAVEEVFHVYNVDENLVPSRDGENEINAWFRDDWRMIQQDELEHALLIYRWQRDELLAGYSTLPAAILEKKFPDQRWNIIGILKHIANAENWYLSRLDFPSVRRSELTEDPLQRLNLAQSLVEKSFSMCVGNCKVSGVEGEFWSCRKLIRRILWHQRDHIDHIKQLAFRNELKT